MRRALALVALTVALSAFADGPDGGAARVVDTYDCPPGDAPVAVDGGWWLSERQKSRLNCIVVAAQTHRDLALQQAAGAETEHLNRLGVVAAVAVVLGIGLGYAAGRLAK